MREIKFRAWDKNKKIVRFVNNINFMFKTIQCSPKHEVDGKIQMCDVTLNENEYELMSYTGLKDIEGFEIYNGFIGFDSHSEAYGVVKYENGQYVYESENITQDLFEIVNGINFVGNIYENPELLEVSND